jgi:hypothetical protein
LEDKTRLEHDIEVHEIPGLPLWGRVLVLLLILVAGSLGLYVMKLRKDNAVLRGDLVIEKEKCRIERSALPGRIQRQETVPSHEGPQMKNGNTPPQSP